jgi:hypothetical protein
MCTVKTYGLDILCEFTDQQHIMRAMSKLKASNEVIYYLKLRHNNLPKLQDFLFLGLDIRHLTIHNCSLAVVEESSINSLGRCIREGARQRYTRSTSRDALLGDQKH